MGGRVRQGIQVQTSTDGTTWTNIFSTTTGDGGTDDLTVTGTGRFVRMHGTARGTAYGYSLFEFEVYGATGPADTEAPTRAAEPALHRHHADHASRWPGTRPPTTWASPATTSTSTASSRDGRRQHAAPSRQRA